MFSWGFFCASFGKNDVGLHLEGFVVVQDRLSRDYKSWVVQNIARLHSFLIKRMTMRCRAIIHKTFLKIEARDRLLTYSTACSVDSFKGPRTPRLVPVLHKADTMVLMQCTPLILAIQYVAHGEQMVAGCTWMYEINTLFLSKPCCWYHASISKGHCS